MYVDHEGLVIVHLGMIMQVGLNLNQAEMTENDIVVKKVVFSDIRASARTAFNSIICR